MKQEEVEYLYRMVDEAPFWLVDMLREALMFAALHYPGSSDKIQNFAYASAILLGCGTVFPYTPKEVADSILQQRESVNPAVIEAIRQHYINYAPLSYR